MQPYFITSSGTSIGKTLVTCALSWQLRQLGKTVTALKPVISGYHPHDPMCDSARILKSCGLQPTPEMMETISPWRFTAPLSPHMAAAQEGTSIDFKAVVDFCREHTALNTDVLLVEGAGGVMVPLDDRHTILDWMIALNWPVILVVGTYLGAISHTLTALEVLRSRGLTVQAVVITESYERAVSLDDTAATIEKFLPKTIPIVKLPRVGVTEDPWKHVPSISWLCRTS